MSHLPLAVDMPLIALAIVWIGYMAWLAFTDAPRRLLLAVLWGGLAIAGGATLIAMSPAGPLIARAWSALPQPVRFVAQWSLSILPLFVNLTKIYGPPSPEEIGRRSGPPLFMR